MSCSTILSDISNSYFAGVADRKIVLDLCFSLHFRNWLMDNGEWLKSLDVSPLPLSILLSPFFQLRIYCSSSKFNGLWSAVEGSLNQYFIRFSFLDLSPLGMAWSCGIVMCDSSMIIKKSSGKYSKIVFGASPGSL